MVMMFFIEAVHCQSDHISTRLKGHPEKMNIGGVDFLLACIFCFSRVKKSVATAKSSFGTLVMPGRIIAVTSVPSR